MGRQGQERQVGARRDARRRRGHGEREPAPPGRDGQQGEEAPHERRQGDQAEGHRRLHPPAVDDDACRRAADPVVRHRRARQHQPEADPAAHRHPQRRRDRHEPVRRIPQAPALLRCPLLQPGRGRRSGRYSRNAARSSRRLPGKDDGDQGQDQVGADLPGRGARGRVRRADGHHDLRHPCVRGRLQVVRRRPAGADAGRHRDVEVLHQLLVPDLRHPRRRNLLLHAIVESDR